MTWQNTSVCADGTHHVQNDKPLYLQRYDEVLKFHAPGLAPVCLDGKAWHIMPDGSDAYSHRFHRVFGFYEGQATVVGKDGWRHIKLDGSDAYPERYVWCGNFQDGRSVVRETTGEYFHITLDGKPVYSERWRYAGDFRDALGVVQSNDGLSTHIDHDGKLIHGQWFFDLDVFHKGFARAQDEQGWCHINKQGKPAYSRRYASVEPFYNGQARVERFDGALEIIDESGQSMVELRPARQSEFVALSGDMVGFWRTQTICTAVELGVFDVLPASALAIEKACSLGSGCAERLLRALAELHLVERNLTQWKLTDRGYYLTSNHPQTLADAAKEYGGHFSEMWAELNEALQVNSTWQPPDIFGDVTRDIDRTDGFHRMMTSYALHDYAAIPEALCLKGDERVVDVGGGLGVLATMMAEAYPQLQVVLIDLPEVVGLASQRGIHARIEPKACDFFLPWEIQADVVLLARVLHDWGDEKAIEILLRARQCLNRGGRVFVVDMLLAEEGFDGSLCDLHLLMVTGGTERTASEYVALFDRAGFDAGEIRSLPTLPAIIEGIAR